MKILLYTDLHMCPRSSIVSRWGSEFPLRLENCIATVNWVQQLAEENYCDFIISLGDFFDRPDLTSDTITAATKISWAAQTNYSLVGNHDASVSSLAFNSVNCLKSAGHVIIDTPTKQKFGSVEICFLPYITEADRQPLASYFGPKTSDFRLILSHNDLAGVQMGPVMSRTGFSVQDIEQNCDLFLNGHLHNGLPITEKIINLGNITGKDFSEDARKYNHGAYIFDTSTKKLTFIENPYAFNFYKLNIETEVDLKSLQGLKSNAILSIKCIDTLQDRVRELIAEMPNVIDARVITTRTSDEPTVCDITSFHVDYLAQFVDCCRSVIDNSQILEDELAEICK